MTAHFRRLTTLLWLLTACTQASTSIDKAVGESPPDRTTVRIALFNIRELEMEKILDVDEQGHGRNPQALAAARIIRRVRPDILVLNEIDHDYGASGSGLDSSARRFRDRYLSQVSQVSPVGQNSDPLELPYSFAAANNTGLLSGLDLDGDGRTATDADRGSRAHGNDSWGYGTYPGEYSMAVLSRFPIRDRDIRTFQKLLWKDLPGHHMPAGHFTAEVADSLRLSSKSHWDVPIEIDGRLLHLFVSHPTPQGFDGAEDKNGRRNFDEIKLWTEYLDDSAVLEDDQGRVGSYRSADPFVVIGDLNAKPLPPAGSREPETDSDGSPVPDNPFRTSIYDGKPAIDQLLHHPRIQDSGPFMTSSGGLTHNTKTPRAPGPPGFPERSTSVFGEGARVDYILPSIDLEILSGGVFWPDPQEDPEAARWAEEASDHRLVWLDLALGSGDS